MAIIIPRGAFAIRGSCVTPAQLEACVIISNYV